MDFSKCCDNLKWDLTLAILWKQSHALLLDIFDGETSNLRNNIVVLILALLSLIFAIFS